ncbi:MAG: hypothetical protein LCH77_13265 [Actinobacteria bacterium]|nr:hypothetical protein [Actinomycetota bacterium]
MRGAPLALGGVGVTDHLIDRMHRVAGLDPLQPGCGLGAQSLGLSWVASDVFEVADLVEGLVRPTTGDHRRRQFPRVSKRA